MKILFVDDEEKTRESFKKILENEGRQVDTASGEQDALVLINKKQYDVVITDMYMEEKNSGLSVAEAAERKLIAVIIITAFPDIDNAASAMERDAFTYIDKNVDNFYEVLKDKIEKAYNYSSRVREIESNLSRLLPHKRLFRISFCITLIFLFSIFSDLLFDFTIIAIEANWFGLIISFVFLIMSYFMKQDWEKADK